MSFFQLSPGKIHLEPFDLYHICGITFTIIAVFAVVLLRKRIRKAKHEKYIPIMMMILPVALEIWFHAATASEGFTEFFINLIPFDLCAMTLWLSVALAITRRKFLFELICFWGIGAVASILYPDCGGLGPDRMRYYHYFIVHTFIILMPIYFAAVHGYRISFKSLVKAVVILFPITILVRFVDIAYGNSDPNFMFLIHPPQGLNSPLDYLPQGGWAYYFSFVALAIGIFLAVFLVFTAVGAVYHLATRKDNATV